VAPDAGRLPTNQELAQVMQTIADYLSLGGESTYRILAYEKAAELFREHPVSVADMAQQGELRKLPGVGEAIEKKVLEYVATGDIEFLAKLRDRFPEGLLLVMRLPGMGPKKTRFVHENAGVADMRGLEKAAREGRLRDLPGMGAKTEENILRAIESWTAATAGADRGRKVRARVEPQAERLAGALRALPQVIAADLAGSLRRCRSTVRDIDLVVASVDPGAVMAVFATLPELARVEAQGETKLTAATYSGLSVDLRVVAPEAYGDLLQHMTGSADHNVALRGYAQRHGYKISEYCVEHVESGRRITCATEAEVYETVGLRYIPPELRENQGEIEAAEAGTLPDLVDLPDLRGDLHVHSDWTDGRASLEQMALAARARGIEYLCFCDHSQSLAMTGGLTPERLLAQQQEIRALDARLEGIRLLSGIEVDILADGRLDLPDDVLARLDFVTASIHSGFSQPAEKIMERILGAMRNPCVSSIAHPSGRLIGRREGYEIDIDVLARTAAETGTFLEINGSADRMDLAAPAARRAASLGAKVVICSDAHHPDDFGNLRWGVGEARRGWLTKEDVATAWDWERVRA
jgi:DNA polymerase (family X)